MSRPEATLTGVFGAIRVLHKVDTPDRVSTRSGSWYACVCERCGLRTTRRGTDLRRYSQQPGYIGCRVCANRAGKPSLGKRKIDEGRRRDAARMFECGIPTRVIRARTGFSTPTLYRIRREVLAKRGASCGDSGDCGNIGGTSGWRPATT